MLKPSIICIATTGTMPRKENDHAVTVTVEERIR
jgi:hypothetical protein